MNGRKGVAVVVTLGVLATAAYAATALRFGPEINVSRTLTATEKAKIVRLAYLHGSTFRKAWLVTYADGAAGRQNVFARHSFDDGATWSDPVLLSRDAAGDPSGGQSFTAQAGLSFMADNGKPTVFAPPMTSGPVIVITWNSAYCPQDPEAPDNAGSYVNPDQGAGDFDEDGTPERPYHCVWVAKTSDPTLMAWDVDQLTNGRRDAINEVVSGNSTATAFALAWQEDPAGLQSGEGEGRGDGGMGSHVTGGTNIWYTHASAPNGALLRANVAQLSNNTAIGTGQPGASRPNLQISGTTAVLAYEETACPGGDSGKCIVYHSFPYAGHDENAAGTIISDVTRNARRVRFVLQGATAAGPSRLRAVLLWRETPFFTPAAPSDIVIRRGLVDTAARPGSTGFLATDVVADPPQYLTNVARFGGNANAHRALVRGSLIVVAYDLTPDMDGANPEKSAVPTANYNLYVTRSIQNGEAGSWTAPLNVSRVESLGWTVVEPRLVPTPGSVVNPLTGSPDAGDTQNANVLYASFATESNRLSAAAGRVYVARSVDQGASFEPFVPVSPKESGQSEAQLRPSPSGLTALILWMGEQTISDPQSKDAVLALASPMHLPDLKLTAGDASFPAYSTFTLDLSVTNRGDGNAGRVRLTGTLPDGLSAIGITEPSVCNVHGAAFECSIDRLANGQSRSIALTVTGAREGRYLIEASVVSDEPDAEPGDNAMTATLEVTQPLSSLPPLSPSTPPSTSPSGAASPTATYVGGGGCSAAPHSAAIDPTLLLLFGLAVFGLVRGGTDALGKSSA